MNIVSLTYSKWKQTVLKPRKKPGLPGEYRDSNQQFIVPAIMPNIYVKSKSIDFFEKHT